MENVERRHAFSVELRGRDALKLVTVPSDSNGNALLEGCLGELVHVGFVEEAMLEIRGTNGIFRIDMKTEELNSLLQAVAQGVKK